MSTLFFDRTANLAQMLAKGVIRIGCALFQMVGKLQLLAKCASACDPVGLLSFCCPDRVCAFQDLFNGFQFNEDATIVIGENHISLRNREIAKSCHEQRVFGARVEPLRPGWTRTVTENWKADLFQLGRVAMCAPDHDSSQFARSCFQHRQIADTAFIGSAAIIDHENVTAVCRHHCFEKNVDTAKMLCRKRAACDFEPGSNRANSKRRDSSLGVQAQGRICD